MKLLVENSENIETLIEEVSDSSGQRKYIISGIFMQAEKKNRNGRIYPKSVMENGIKKYITDYVNPKRALGELNHPSGPQVNMDKVSHIITELHFDGDNIMGKANILDTPNGNIVKSFIKEGVQFGVSSRGLGTLKEVKGEKVVQNDFWLSAVDIVHDPSAHDAFVQGLMEGKEWVWENGILVERVCEEIKEEIEQACSSIDTGKYDIAKLNAFYKYMNVLSNK